MARFGPKLLLIWKSELRNSPSTYFNYQRRLLDLPLKCAQNRTGSILEVQSVALGWLLTANISQLAAPRWLELKAVEHPCVKRRWPEAQGALFKLTQIL